MYSQGTTFRPAALNRCSGRLLVPAPAAAIRLMKMCVRHSSLSVKPHSIIHTRDGGEVITGERGHEEAEKVCVTGKKVVHEREFT